MNITYILDPIPVAVAARAGGARGRGGVAAHGDGAAHRAGGPPVAGDARRRPRAAGARACAHRRHAHLH